MNKKKQTAKSLQTLSSQAFELLSTGTFCIWKLGSTYWVDHGIMKFDYLHYYPSNSVQRGVSWSTALSLARQGGCLIVVLLYVLLLDCNLGSLRYSLWQEIKFGFFSNLR